MISANTRTDTLPLTREQVEEEHVVVTGGARVMVLWAVRIGKGGEVHLCPGEGRNSDSNQGMQHMKIQARASKEASLQRAQSKQDGMMVSRGHLHGVGEKGPHSHHVAEDIGAVKMHEKEHLMVSAAEEEAIHGQEARSKRAAKMQEQAAQMIRQQTQQTQEDRALKAMLKVVSEEDADEEALSLFHGETSLPMDEAGALEEKEHMVGLTRATEEMADIIR